MCCVSEGKDPPHFPTFAARCQCYIILTASQPNLPWTTKQKRNELTQTLQLCLCSSKDLAFSKTASGCNHLACIFSGNICVDGVVENPASLDNKISKRPEMSSAKVFIRIGCEKSQILPTRSEAERTEALKRSNCKVLLVDEV